MDELKAGVDCLDTRQEHQQEDIILKRLLIFGALTVNSKISLPLRSIHPSLRLPEKSTLTLWKRMPMLKD